MGFQDIRICIFTGYDVTPIINARAAVEYMLEINNVRHIIRFSGFLDPKNEYIKRHEDILFALLYNNDWFEDENVIIDIENLKQLIASKSLPISPAEKIEYLFLHLFNQQKEDGETIAIDTHHYDALLWKLLYFKSRHELNYYVQVLHDKGLITAKFEKNKDRYDLLESYNVTYEGLNYQIKLATEGDKSNKCFIAMSFLPDMMDTRAAIKNALTVTGFLPIIVDEENIDADRTINDEIIAGLKRCKFCIADFTHHSKGVYFESGYALGQGKKVIYTCQKNEFENAHFDIKPLQHIIYETPTELETKLISKIEAWVK